MTPTSVALLTISRRAIMPPIRERGIHSSRSDSLRSVGSPARAASSVRKTKWRASVMPAAGSA